MRRAPDGTGVLRAAGVGLAGLAAFALAVPLGLAYSFRDARQRVVTSAQAPRWADDNRSVAFRLLENGNDDGLRFWRNGEWQETARRALWRWTHVPPATIRLFLEDETVNRNWASTTDGLNTIGVSSFPLLLESRAPAAVNSTTIRNGVITGCDIELNPMALEKNDRALWLEAWILHQIGHCLGLGHTERFSATTPDPVMSDGHRDNELTADDISGVSGAVSAARIHRFARCRPGGVDRRGGISDCVRLRPDNERLRQKRPRRSWGVLRPTGPLPRRGRPSGPERADNPSDPQSQLLLLSDG